MKKTKLLFLFSFLLTAVVTNFSNAGELPSFNADVKNIGSEIFDNSIDYRGSGGTALLMHSPFGRHKCARGAHYCLCSGGICWKDIFLDKAPPNSDFGTFTTTVITNSAGIPTALRMTFFDDPQPINGTIPVDSNEMFNSNVSNALGFKNIIMHGGDYPVDYSHSQYGEIVVEAEFVNYGETAAGSPFGRHKCTRQAHYCLCSGGICWKDIFHMSDENVSELLDYGWYAMTVENGTQGVTNSVRIRFLNDPQPDNGYLSVDTTALSTEISNELGYESVVLLEGDYYVDYSNNEYGEIIVLADLTGPVKALSLKIIPEGFLSNIFNLNIKDRSVIYLRSASAPFAIADADTVTIDSLTFSGNSYFYNAPAGNYYIDVKHRNSIETWSSNTVSIGNTPASYDFTSAASQAYGNNMNLKFGKYCTYSGDVNQDGVIELSDITDVFNDASSFLTGYVVTDVTGDNLVDLGDLTIVFNNSSAFVGNITP